MVSLAESLRALEEARKDAQKSIRQNDPETKSRLGQFLSVTIIWLSADVEYLGCRRISELGGHFPRGSIPYDGGRIFGGSNRYD